MNTGQGRPSISPRIVLGALIIKHKENLSDQKTIEAIQENIYMQFFVGLQGFQTDKIFDSSLFVTIRKRIGKTEFDVLNAKLLNSSRKKLDEMIDKLYHYHGKKMTKPRTYRRAINTAFLNYSKNKNKGKSAHRKMKRKLLESVNRNLNFVKVMLLDTDDLVMGKEYPLFKKDLALIEVIETVYLQQKQMYDDNTNTCKERIVSIYQVHVRPILRGKQNARVEFGAKLGVSLDNGFTDLNHLSWNAYHAGKDLIGQVEQYFKIHRYYPDLVQVDKAYSTRENRNWLKERNIRKTAPQLGHKPKQPINQYQKTKLKKEAAERNDIEAKFGQGKNGYNLNKIRAKLKATSESWISCIFFVMNLINYQKKISFGSIFQQLLSKPLLLLKDRLLQNGYLNFIHLILKKNTTFSIVG
tara:strand:+ start:10602 stop:11837 length:1236 start_codon:yes stop_codon:yes gene_type:complete